MINEIPRETQVKIRQDFRYLKCTNSICNQNYFVEISLVSYGENIT